MKNRENVTNQKPNDGLISLSFFKNSYLYGIITENQAIKL